MRQKAIDEMIMGLNAEISAIKTVAGLVFKIDRNSSPMKITLIAWK